MNDNGYKDSAMSDMSGRHQGSEAAALYSLILSGKV